MLVLGLHSKDRTSTKDKANIRNPKVNRGCPLLTANCTSADCVQISFGPPIQYIALRVYHIGGFNAMYDNDIISSLSFHWVLWLDTGISRSSLRWFSGYNVFKLKAFPDSKVHRANMGPTWVLSSPGGPHAGPMNLAIRVGIQIKTRFTPRTCLALDIVIYIAVSL